MGRFYYAPFQCSAITASIQLWSLQPATADPIVLHAWEISNYGADVGDAAEEMLELHLVRSTGSPASGAGGAVTELPAIQDDTATTTVALMELTTDWDTGTVELIWRTGWNVRAPYLWLPQPGAGLQVKDNDVIFLDLVTAPADAIDINGGILYEEV